MDVHGKKTFLTITQSLPLLILFFELVFGSHAQASPASLTYQGRIVKSDGTPLEYGNVSFLFEITNPTGTCVIYREQKDGISMINSKGVFDVPIGTGTKLFPADPLFGLLDSFSNSKTHNCYGGSTYVAASGDLRLLKVQFHDGTGWKVISPASEIRSVPYAGFSLSSQKLGSYDATDFVLKTGIPNCSSGTFLTWDGAAFQCSAVSGASGGTVTQVTSTNNYISVATNTSTPALTLNVGTSANTVAAGNDSRIVNALQNTTLSGGDLSGTFSNLTVAKLNTIPLSSTTPTNGQYFKFDGTQWVGASIVISDVTNLSSTFNNYVTSANFNSAVLGANCSNSETPYWSSVSGTFLCQNISLTMNGDVSGTNSTISVNKIKGISVDTTGISSGHILKYDGSKWITAAETNSGGTVTGISSANNYLSVTNGSTSATLTVNVGTTANTVAAGNDSRITNALQNTSSAGGDASGTFSNLTVTKIQNTAISSTAPTTGQFLKFDGTQWLPNAIAINDVTNLTTTLSGYLATTAFTTAVSPASCLSNETPYWNSGTGKFACQSISLSLGGDVSGAQNSVTVDKIKGINVDTTGITSGHILKYDGSKWITAAESSSGGTVTSVTSTNSYLSVANSSSTPSLTLNVGTTANTVAAGNDSRITNALQAGTSAGGDLTGTYPNPTLADGVVTTTKLFTNPGANRLVMTDATTGNTLTAAACSLGEVLNWTAVGWSCSTQFKAGAVPTATNYILLSGALSGSSVEVSATGTDTNVSLSLAAKGSGNIQINSSYTERSPASANSGAAYTIPDATYNVRNIIATANTTITLPSAPTSSNTVYTLTVKVQQDATGGRIISWSAPVGESIKWDSSLDDPEPAYGANKETIYQFYKFSGNSTWYGTQAWKEY